MSSLVEQLTFGIVLEGRIVKIEGTFRTSDKNLSTLDELEFLEPFFDQMRDFALRAVTDQTEIRYLLKVVNLGATERISYHSSGERVSLAKRISNGL